MAGGAARGNHGRAAALRTGVRGQAPPFGALLRQRNAPGSTLLTTKATGTRAAPGGAARERHGRGDYGQVPRFGTFRERRVDGADESAAARP